MTMSINDYWKKIQSQPDWLYIAILLAGSCAILFFGTLLIAFIEGL